MLNSVVCPILNWLSEIFVVDDLETNRLVLSNDITPFYFSQKRHSLLSNIAVIIFLFLVIEHERADCSLLYVLCERKSIKWNYARILGYRNKKKFSALAVLFW